PSVRALTGCRLGPAPIGAAGVKQAISRYVTELLLRHTKLASAERVAQESAHVEQPVIRSLRGWASLDPQRTVERIHRKRCMLCDQVADPGGAGECPPARP